MSEQAPVIKPEYIIEDLLEQNKQLTKEKSYQKAMNLQLQEESRSFLELAKQMETKVKELEEKLLAEKAKTAGPVPTNNADIIDMETKEAN